MPERGTTVTELARNRIAPCKPVSPNALWQATRTDNDLHQSILQGKGKLMLPMKDKLSTAAANQMVTFVRAFADGKQVVPSVEPANNPPPTGAVGIFRQYCFVCHGADGRGAAMRASLPPLPDFTSRTWQAGITNPQMAVSILQGKGTLMPQFGDRITNEQAKELASYIRSLGPLSLARPLRVVVRCATERRRDPRYKRRAVPRAGRPARGVAGLQTCPAGPSC